MNISVNGETVEVTATLLSDILDELGYGEAMVATAVNEEFVPVNQRSTLSISQGQRIEIVAPRQGG